MIQTDTTTMLRKRILFTGDPGKDEKNEESGAGRTHGECCPLWLVGSLKRRR
jgi:hypothetical protein